MADSSVPVYYELSWSILSTIGLANVFFGITVAGISGFPPISIVPIVVSAACAIANGLCYYAFYSDYPPLNMAIASAFADVTWLIQEAGLSFYSYVILRQVLESRARTTFMGLFWSLIAAISALRIAILILRVQYINNGSQPPEALKIINTLHIGYFTSIALIECLSAVFLLRKFRWARLSTLSVGLFSYLMRSTEIRLALLALVGVTRAVTYSFQATVQSATTVASQLDRFAYTLECMFPVMMFIDILSSRLVFANNGRADVYSSNRNASNHHSQRQANQEDGNFAMMVLSSKNNHTSTQVEQSQSRRSSQEPIAAASQFSSGVTHIIEGSSRRSPSLDGDSSGISKKVEFQVYETREV